MPRSNCTICNLREIDNPCRAANPIGLSILELSDYSFVVDCLLRQRDAEAARASHFSRHPPPPSPSSTATQSATRTLTTDLLVSIPLSFTQTVLKNSDLPTPLKLNLLAYCEHHKKKPHSSESHAAAQSIRKATLDAITAVYAHASWLEPETGQTSQSNKDSPNPTSAPTATAPAAATGATLRVEETDRREGQALSRDPKATEGSGGNVATNSKDVS